MFLIIDVVKAIVVRLVLGVHSLLAVWRVVSIAGDNFYWWLGLVDVGLIAEGFITIIARKGMEYKWFCPCFLIYLGGTVPSIWILELDRRERLLQNVNQVTEPSNITTEIPTTTEIRESGIAVGGFEVPVSIELPADKWVQIIEQLLLYFMIVGRWVLPRGSISRNELSQLLFVFIGMASDITELLTLFDEKPIRNSLVLTCVVLLLWSLSLVQFCFVLTATKNPNRTRVALNDENEKMTCKYKCCSTEMWSIFVSMCMQDLPFLMIRAYAIIKFHLVTYSIIFFTAKNVLIILVLLYRMAVICGHKGIDDENDVENQKGTANEQGNNNHQTNHSQQNVNQHNYNNQQNFNQQSFNNNQNLNEQNNNSYQNHQRLRHQNHKNHHKELQYYRHASAMQQQSLPNIAIVDGGHQLNHPTGGADSRVQRWIKENKKYSHMNGNARKNRYVNSNGTSTNYNGTTSSTSLSVH